MRLGALAVALVCAVALVAALATDARGDGAFPDSMALFAPADRPHELVLGTNFGLVLTDDDGATWHLVCEPAIATFVSMYQMTAPPDDALFAETPYGLAWSRDGGCTFTFATGALAGAVVGDAFPDPTDASRAFALAVPMGDGGGGPAGAPALFQSSDGGRSFGASALFTAPAGVTLAGVENARAAPSTVYLSGYSFPPLATFLARSTGGPFATVDITAAVGGVPRIAAVDPVDPMTVYLRVEGATSDALAITHDGGPDAAVALTLAGKMGAFLRRASGTILVGAPDGPSFRSTDGGKNFAMWPNAPHLRALAERDGVLFAAADDQRDGYAVASSTDEGATWTPRLRLRDIAGPLQCGNLPSVCAGPWAAVLALVTSAPPPDLAAAPGPTGGGCGCTLARRAPPGNPLALALVFLVLKKARRRMVRRPEQIL